MRETPSDGQARTGGYRAGFAAMGGGDRVHKTEAQPEPGVAAAEGARKKRNALAMFAMW